MFQHMGMWTWPDAVNEEDPARMIERLQAAKIDIVIPYLCSRASGAEKTAYEARLHAIVDEAHRHGEQVHGCFDEINAYETMPVYALRQVYQDGTLSNSLCPAHPEVVAYVLEELARYLHEFDFDGINLEDGYIFNHATIYDPAHTLGEEYRIMPVCYCDYCRQHAPIEQPEWAHWRRERLTGSPLRKPNSFAACARAFPFPSRPACRITGHFTRRISRRSPITAVGNFARVAMDFPRIG